MKRWTLPGAVLVIVCAGITVLPSRAAPIVVTAKTPPVFEKKLVASAPPEVVERLKKVGLDPKDPNLGARLKTLALQNSPAYARSHVESITPRVQKVSLSAKSLLSKVTVNPAPKVRARAARHLRGAVGPDFWDDNFNLVPLASAALSERLYSLIVSTDGEVAFPDGGPFGYAGSMSVAFPCGGVILHPDVEVIPGENFKGTKQYLEHAGPFYYYVVGVGPGTLLPIGRPRSGQISISFGDASASATATYAPSQATVTISVTIDHTPTVAGVGSVSPWGSTGLAARNALLQYPGTPRVGAGDWNVKTEGTDLVGDGVQVGPGWTITSTVIKSAVSAAAPQETTPENIWRGASVTLQPQGGTLRTGVRWHYSGIDSLDYTVEWVLTGPLGRRPILTMAKYDSCED